EPEAPLEPYKSLRHVWPGIEPVPSKVEVTHGRLRQARDAETRQDPFEIVPMQHVELAERHAARAHLVHRGLVFGAPGIGEGEPVEQVALRLEDDFRFARDAGTPIDQRAEHVEEQRLHAGRGGRAHEPAGSMPFDLSTSAAAGPESALMNALAASVCL